MPPSIRDYAEFAQLALRFKLLDVHAVQAWADTIIAAHEQPPLWAIELALATPAYALEVLRTVPGTRSNNTPALLLLALLRRRWHAGTLSVRSVHTIAWSLHCGHLIPSLPHEADWGLALDYQCEELEEGLCTGQEIRAFITDSLEHYASYDSLLPTWVSLPS